MLTLAIISLSAVCASENATDSDVGAIGDDAVLAEVSNPEIIANDSGDGSEIIKSDSEIQASSATGYESFSTKFTLTLTSNGLMGYMLSYGSSRFFFFFCFFSHSSYSFCFSFMRLAYDVLAMTSNVSV